MRTKEEMEKRLKDVNLELRSIHKEMKEDSNKALSQGLSDYYDELWQERSTLMWVLKIKPYHED